MERSADRDVLHWLARLSAHLAAAIVLFVAAGALSAATNSAGNSASNSAQAPPSTGHPGGSMADFDSLIDLIKSTVDPQSWTDVGGNGTAVGFEGGVYIDAQGTMRERTKSDTTGALAELRLLASMPAAASEHDVCQPAQLRKISLVRLERQAQALAAQGLPPTQEMQTLAGLERIKYVLVYPEEGEIVLAGPAGDWQMNAEGRLVSTSTNHPVMRLDDLVVVLRQILSGPKAAIACSITPTKAALANVQIFLNQSGSAPLKSGQLESWMKKLRDQLGSQEIIYENIDPRSAQALVMLEADYRMKLVGMGLEDGVPGVPSYLDMVDIPPGQPPPPMNVLRWWFTMNYDAILAAPKRDAFELVGQGLQVLSENEMLTAAGQQMHTGAADDINRQFAFNFTQHFAELANKYPIYAELQNLSDMALAAEIIRSEKLLEKTHWQMSYFGKSGDHHPMLAAAPKMVETVINRRIINGNGVLIGVSGGVRLQPSMIMKPGLIKTDNDGLLDATRSRSSPGMENDKQAWWCD